MNIDLGNAYKSLATSEMAICPCDVVLDLGCGPGADLPAFAEAVAGGGRVIGVDNDPDAVRKARDRTAGLPMSRSTKPMSRPLTFRRQAWTGFTPTGFCSTCRTPEAALAEARRVLRDGGTAVFAEPDWDTLVIDYPDLATARAYTRYIADHVVRNAALGRQMPRLAAEAGFRVGKVPGHAALLRVNHPLHHHRDSRLITRSWP